MPEEDPKADAPPVARRLDWGPTGIGTSTTRIAPARGVCAEERSSASGGAQQEQEKPDVSKPGPPADGGVLVWGEPRLNRMDAAAVTAAMSRQAERAETVVPGRSRLLYPVRWQSPYPDGNRYADLFERCTIEWLTRFGLIVNAEDLQTIKEFECGLYGGLSSPTSNLRDGLLITQFVSLWLYFDDRIIEDSTVFDIDDPVGTRTTKAAAGGPAAFVNAWNDLCDRLRRTQSEAWMQRLGKSLKAWIENSRRESRNAKIYQRTGALPSFETMLAIRTVSIGMYPTFYLIEMAEGFELPESVHEHQTVVELKRLASRLVGYGNDIGGLAKDLAGKWPNLVLAMKEERGIPMEDAFDEVVRMYNTEVVRLSMPSRRSFPPGGLTSTYRSGNGFRPCAAACSASRGGSPSLPATRNGGRPLATGRSPHRSSSSRPPGPRPATGRSFRRFARRG
ncbi:MAG: terpene synthase family protein [Methylococcales bacterium]